MKRHFDEEDIEWLIEKLSQIQTRTPFVNKVGCWCEEQRRISQARQGAAQLERGLNAEFDLLPQLEHMRNGGQEEMVDLCRMCGSIPVDPFKPKVITKARFRLLFSSYSSLN